MPGSLLVPPSREKMKNLNRRKSTRKQKWIPFYEFINDDKLNNVANIIDSTPKTKCYASRDKYRSNRKLKKFPNFLPTSSSASNYNKKSQIDHHYDTSSQQDCFSSNESFFLEFPSCPINSPIYPFSPPPLDFSQVYPPHYFESYFHLPYKLSEFGKPQNIELENLSDSGDRIFGAGVKTIETSSTNDNNNNNNVNFESCSMGFSTPIDSYCQDFNPNFLFGSPISPVTNPNSPLNIMNPLVVNLPPPQVNKKPLSTLDKIKNQIEYYFSVSNLCKDIYLRNLINKKTGGIKLQDLIKFKRLKILTGSNTNILIEAIQKYQTDLHVQLINDNKEIRIEKWKQWIL